MSPEEDRTRDAVDSEPKHYQLSYSGPKPRPKTINLKMKMIQTIPLSSVLPTILVNTCTTTR